MRVITGTLGGRTLRHPAGRSFRPTTDRVKESVFNVLTHGYELGDARVCDLFAGSGALGIEALSRGARSCVFVERAHDSLRVLRANLAALGLEARSRVVEGRAEEYVRRAADCFDIILADPPYAFDAREDLVDGIVTSSLLAPEGVLVFEHAADAVLTARSGWRCADRRAFGTTAVTFIRHTAMEEPR